MSKIVEITKDGQYYPRQLNQIHNPPEKLYCRGNVELLASTCFGVVGTRKLTSYGKEATEYIVPELARYFTVVSGLALGIDALAHKITLENNGLTIAVLGTGVDDKSIYPQTNANLAQEILKKNGLIISEYEPGTAGFKGNFPQRNRIISGLSKGVLVVEADKESGSLITAQLALEQNRDVFAVPGSIFSSRSAGTNQIIQKGAKLISHANDILEDYMETLPVFKERGENLSTQNPVEKKILDILDLHGEVIVDEIVRKADMETSQVISSLAMLEIKGLVSGNDGKYKLKN